MKKRFWVALLCVALLAQVASVALANADDHEHQYSGKTEIVKQPPVYTPVDATTHRVTIDQIEYPVCDTCSQYGSTLAYLDPIVSNQPHHFVNGVCIDCKYSCQHAFKQDNYTPETTTDEYKNFGSSELHSKSQIERGTVRITCEYCDYNSQGRYSRTISNTTEPHTFENGICTACQYQCYHYGLWNDGVCKICGFECPHENTKVSFVRTSKPDTAVEIVGNDEGHSVMVQYENQTICNTCRKIVKTEVLDEETGESGHHYSNGVCQDCGHVCAHSNTIPWEEMLEDEEHTVTYAQKDQYTHIASGYVCRYKSCEDCGRDYEATVSSGIEEIEKKHRKRWNQESDRYECLCGYVFPDCDHTDVTSREQFEFNNGYKQIEDDDEYHFAINIYEVWTDCSVCGENIDRDEVRRDEKEPHNYTTNGVCRKCGHVRKEAPHTHTPGEAVKENIVASKPGEKGHYDEVVYCTACKEELSRKTVETDALPVEEPVVEEPKTEEPKTEEPKTEEPKTEEPKTEEPKTEEPKAEEPTTEEPKAEEPKTEEPKTEEPKTEEPKAEEPKSEEPTAEEPKTEEPTTEEPATEEPKTEEPKTEEPTTEETKTEEPKTEEPKAEEPKAEEPTTKAPTTEEPKAEEPKAEEPKAEKPKADEPKTEEPKTEEPKTEEPKTEEPKTEEPKTEESKTETAAEPVQYELVYEPVSEETEVNGVKAADHQEADEVLKTVGEALEGETVTVTIPGVEKILNAEEKAKFDTLPVKDRLLVTLSALGFADELGGEVEGMSDEAKALSESIAERMVAMDEAEKQALLSTIAAEFPKGTVTVDGAEHESFSIDLEIERNGEKTYERYTFYEDGGVWKLHGIEKGVYKAVE